MTSTEPVRYGILGAANIARMFTKGVAGSTLATVVARRIARRRPRALPSPRKSASSAITRATRRCWPIRRSRPSISRCPTTCTRSGRSRRPPRGKHILCERADRGRRSRCPRDDSTLARKHGVHLAEAYPYMSQPQNTATACTCSPAATSARSRPSPPRSGSGWSRPTAIRWSIRPISVCDRSARAAPCSMPAPMRSR